MTPDLLDEGLRTLICVHCRHSVQHGYQRYCDDGKNIFEHAKSGECPRQRYVEVNLPPGVNGAPLTPEQQAEQERHQKELAARLARAGRAHWHELHTRQSPTPTWFADWLARIPAFGCSCRREFDVILSAADPPPFDDPAAFHRWGWARHNDVRRKLKQDELDYPAAALLYGWT